ncbi:MAG TPA: alpha/beta fold hydrolase, partial [Actinomycetota bacterium]|nr:alpha/beta fold hydrolase [Actinomycetota bacterium]
GTKSSFLPTLKALSPRFRVLACDLPGSGDAAKPVAPYTASWFFDRVIELLDEMGIDRASFVGNSMGGRVAIEAGLRAPERCDRLVLLCPALAFTRFRYTVPIVRFMRAEVGVLPFAPPRSAVIRTLRSIFAHPERVPAHWFEASADEFFRVYRKPRGRIAFWAAARSIYLDEPGGRNGFWARLAQLEVPSHFVFGRHDALIPHSFADRVAEVLPEAGISLFEECGHVPQLEDPERTHRVIRSLLG